MSGVLESVRIPWPELATAEDVRAWNIPAWTAVCRVTYLAGHWPGRRLDLSGSDRPRVEEGTNRRLGNKYAHLANRMLSQWSWGTGVIDIKQLEEEPDWTPEERTAAAVLDWYTWAPAQLVATARDRVDVVRWAQDNGMQKQSASLINVLDQSLKGQVQVLRWARVRADQAGRTDQAEAIDTALEHKGRLLLRLRTEED